MQVRFVVLRYLVVNLALCLVEPIGGDGLMGGWLKWLMLAGSDGDHSPRAWLRQGGQRVRQVLRPPTLPHQPSNHG